jgi:hypothetical protein
MTAHAVRRPLVKGLEVDNATIGDPEKFPTKQNRRVAIPGGTQILTIITKAAVLTNKSVQAYARKSRFRQDAVTVAIKKEIETITTGARVM